MFMQRERKQCREIIIKNYEGDPILMVDRKGRRGYYYSVWHVGEHLLEVTIDGNLVEVFDYLPSN